MKTTTEHTVMNQNILFVPLNRTIDNRDQAGTIDNKKMLEIAASLKEHRNDADRIKGLLQVPAARLNPDGCYELAFGRHRRAAFFYLSLTDDFFKEMPLNVCVMDDLQMLVKLGEENLTRRDINPIEEGEFYRTYEQKSGKNHEETAEVFHKTAEHVRGRVWLLGMAEPAKELVISGKMNIGTARGVRTAQKVLNDEQMTQLIEDLKSGEFDENPQEAVEAAVQTATQSLSGIPWINDPKFPVKYLAPLQKKDLADLLDVDAKDLNGRREALNELMTLIASGMEITDEQFPGFTAEQLEKVRVLVNPPACTSCPLHVQMDNSHRCSQALCKDRKTKAWEQYRVHKLSKDLGIDLYVNEQTDGKAVELYRYIDADMKLFKDRHADLRLRPTNRTIWNNFPEVPGNVLVVAVGKTAEKRLKAEQQKADGSKQDNEKRKADDAAAQLKMQIYHLTEQICTQFTYDVIARAFEPLVSGLTSLPFALYMFTDTMDVANSFPQGVDDEGEQIEQIRSAKKKAEGLKQLHHLLAYTIVDWRLRDWADEIGDAKRPIAKLAEYTKKLADEWGVKLLKDFDQQTAKYEDEFETAVKELKAK